MADDLDSESLVGHDAPPARDTTGARPPADAGRSLHAGTETILVVEDDPNVRAAARESLQARGYQVLAASGAEPALAVAGAHPDPIHLLLTDLVMPGMNGCELAKQLALPHPETKLLAMSGYSRALLLERGLVDEHTPFIQKPFTGTDLAGKVREVLDG